MARKSALAEKYRPEGYLDGFDGDTLWYDAIWRDGTLSLVCPPLNNLRKAIRTARFRGDGAPLKLKRIRRYKRHEVVELAAPQAPRQVSIYLGDWRGESAVSHADDARFDGANVMFYVSRNNDLSWLADHARFHTHHHGADALIVMDNGSDAYQRADIEAALRPIVPNLLVMDACFKYGPVGLPPFRRLEKYMQTALFNVLRLRYLNTANAVLSVDIDELVLTTGPSIFDAARESRLGFVQIKGNWVHPAPGSTGPFAHADHGFRKTPPEPCPPKWAWRPDGPLAGWSWDIHGIERLPMLHNRTDERFRFAHCRGVSTGWKKLSRLKPVEGTEPDDELAAAIDAAGLDNSTSPR